jgi:hypothetical protein
LGYAEYRLLLFALIAVVVVYLVMRTLRSRDGGTRRSSGPRDPTDTIRQLARVRDVDGLRHFFAAKGSSDLVRAAAHEELETLSRGGDPALATRALVALASAPGSLDAAGDKSVVERVVAAIGKADPTVLAWLTSGPGLSPTSSLAAALSKLRKEEGTSPAARVAASAALLGAGVLGARAGAFLAAYRKQLDVEEEEDDDMGGGTALFSDPVDEPCAVISPVAVEEEILLSTSGRVLLRRKVADERISEASDGHPARVERRWEIAPPPAARLAAILESCAAAVDAVVSDEPRSA